MMWRTRAEQADVRTNGNALQAGPIDLLLDGQQRVTSLYGVVRGSPPSFFDGDAKAFTDLYFNLESGDFDFFVSNRMRNNPLWVKVSSLFTSSQDWITNLTANQSSLPNLHTLLQKGMQVRNILDMDLPDQSLTGDDKTTDMVVNIFNKVNSGGTKLSHGDLALARICAHWPEARSEMQERLEKWKANGFDADLDWLLRCVTAVVAGGSKYQRLERVEIPLIKQSLRETANAVDHLLEAMRSHLYMDTDRVFSSKQAFPVMVKYLVKQGGRFPDQSTMAQILHWYFTVAIWGRFSGPTETVINQDLGALEGDAPIESLRFNFRQSQGQRTVTHENFDVNYTKSRFYPLLYVMSRVHDARDWGTGNQLRHHSLGGHTNLEMHHIFPRAYLGRNGVPGSDANNIGNIAFQTGETNRAIGSRPPSEYMPEIVERWPGTLESQWVPTDPELWKVENYSQFIEKRRHLLAEAANHLLETLRSGSLPPAREQIAAPNAVVPPEVIEPVSSRDPDGEMAILTEIGRFVSGNGLAPGIRAHEVVSDDTGELIAVFDMAWPDGLQSRYSQPVAVLIDENNEVRLAANDAGFRVFTSPEGFRRYVDREILAEEVQSP